MKLIEMSVEMCCHLPSSSVRRCLLSASCIAITLPANSHANQHFRHSQAQQRNRVSVV